MNAAAFTAPYGASLARSTFTGTGVPLCATHVLSASPRPSRSARMHPRMVGDAPAPDAEEPVPVEEPAQVEEPVLADEPVAEDVTAPIGDEVEADVGVAVDAPAAVEEVDLSDVEPCAPPQFLVNAEAIAEARAKFKLHETDSGSPEFQIATLSTRIAYLTTHLKKNPKDYSSTRGLLKMVSTRRKLLKFLKRENVQRFNNIISGLNIRVSQQLRDL